MKEEIQHLMRIARHEDNLFWPRFAFQFSRYAFLKYVLRKPFALRKIHGRVMKLSLQDPGISRALFLLGDREREHRYLLEKTLRPDMKVLDLGANIGYYVLIEHALLGENASILAVEPVKDNFVRLQENIALNKLANTTSVHAAVSDQDGETKIYLSRLSNVHSLIKDPTSKQTGAFEMVPAISLQTIRKQYGDIDFIRMDIEGYETRILQSILNINTKERFTPTILFELHQKTYEHESFNKLLSDLNSIGYSVQYAAVSNKRILGELGISIEESVPTDGTVRHIVSRMPLEKAHVVAWHARCIVLGM